MKLNRIRSNVSAPAHGLDQIRYAAAYIHPFIRRAWVEDGVWWVEVSEALDAALLDAGLEKLCQRFGNTAIPDIAPLYTQPPRADGYRGKLADGVALLHEHDPNLAPGLFVARPAFADLLRFLDWAMLRRFAKPFAAVEETYPNVIPLSTLAKTNHLTGFPEHLHFVLHLTEDLGVLDEYATRMKAADADPAPKAGELAPSVLVHNPSTCYHCYASRQGARLDGDQAIAAITRCHRYESANHSDPGRLLEFTMREVIFVGSPDYARNTRARCLELIQQWAADWQFAGAIVQANDPFFTSEYDVKASHQHRMAMKYEYRAILGDHGKAISVMSSNLHSATFGKAFDILAEGRRANTGCIGFGLERMALALIAQHGLDKTQWPEALRNEHAAWAARDPLLS